MTTRSMDESTGSFQSLMRFFCHFIKWGQGIGVILTFAQHPTACQGQWMKALASQKDLWGISGIPAAFQQCLQIANVTLWQTANNLKWLNMLLVDGFVENFDHREKGIVLKTYC